MIKLKDLITEGKPRAGDYVKVVTGEVGQINKVKGTIAWIKLASNRKSFFPSDIKNLKPTGKREKGKTLWTEGIITEAAWFTNLRKDGKEWMMDVNGKPTELDKLLGIKGDKAQLYFLSDDNVPDYGRYWAIEREAIKNAKGYSSSTMKVGMKLIPMKELRVWGKAARQLIFIPLKGKDSVGKDITRKYKKVK